MCNAMASSGDFLMLPCMDIADPDAQAQCLKAMEQAKTVWSESKALNLALKEGELLLNGAPIVLPVSI